MSAAAAPPDRPAIPPLVAGGDEGPRSFVVEGVMRFDVGAAVGLRIARAADRELCVFFDASDGTPILISDGRQTLVYDLANDRIVHVAGARANVRIDYDPAKVRPMSFSFGAHMGTQKKLAESGPWVRLDRLAAAADLRLTVEGATHRYVTEGGGKTTHTLEVDPADATRFAYASRYAEVDVDGLTLRASHVGVPPPAGALAFPDLDALRGEMPIVELSNESLADFARALSSGRGFVAKWGLASGTAIRGDMAKLLPDADWDALRRADATLGARYRAALAKQGIRFSIDVNGATTRPATRADD